MKATYQTRIASYAEVDRPAGDAALSAYAELYGRVERRLFAKMAAGESAASLKSAYVERFGIPARLFNAVRVSLQGKVASVRESQKLRVDDLRRRIVRAKKRVAKAGKDGRPDQAHHKTQDVLVVTDRKRGAIGDAVAKAVDYARGVGKPVAIERLDFRQKKAALEGESRKYSRMLSSLSYATTLACFLSRGHREGVEIHQVNPAFSSVIGRVKFMDRYGLSVDQAAALVLARRLLRCSERIPRRRTCPVGNGGHVAFRVPVRKHVWTYWGWVSGQLRPALAAHHRLGNCRDGPNPIQAFVRAVARRDGLDGDPFGVPG